MPGLPVKGAIGSCQTAKIEVIFGLTSLYLVVKKHPGSYAIRWVKMIEKHSTLPAAMELQPMETVIVYALSQRLHGEEI